MDDFRGQRQERTEGGRTIITEPGRVIVRDPNGQSFVRHNDVDRFRYGARDVRVDRQGNDNRTIVVRPDGSQIITLTDDRGGLLRRSRRGPDGREVIPATASSNSPRCATSKASPSPPPRAAGIACRYRCRASWRRGWWHDSCKWQACAAIIGN